MNKKGITLTEVIIATFIITILSAGMLSSFIGARHFLNRARHRLEALNFARETLDRLRSNYSYTDTQLNNGSHTESEIGTILKGEIKNLGSSLTYDVTEPAVDGYKKVEVHIVWTEPSF